MKNLIIKENEIYDNKELKETGYISAYKNSKVSLPNVKTTWSISAYENSKVSMPNVQTTGYIYAYENSKVSLPNVQTTGGISAHENSNVSLPNVQETGNIYAHENCKIEIPQTKGKKYRSIDNTLFIVENKRKIKGYVILKGYILQSIKNGIGIEKHCFVAQKDGFNAHGPTIKEAIKDLENKILSEKIKHEPIFMDTMIDINYYHVVTGSCILGIKSWMQQNNITVDSISVRELLPILEKTNAYNLDKLKKLIK